MSEFIDGLNMFSKNSNAPDFVLGDLSIDYTKLKVWCETVAPTLAKPSSDGISRVKAQVLMSQSGKPYIKINNYDGSATSQPAPTQSTPPSQTTAQVNIPTQVNAPVPQFNPNAGMSASADVAEDDIPF